MAQILTYSYITSLSPSNLTLHHSQSLIDFLYLFICFIVDSPKQALITGSEISPAADNCNKPKPPFNQVKTLSSDNLSKPLKGKKKREIHWHFCIS